MEYAAQLLLTVLEACYCVVHVVLKLREFHLFFGRGECQLSEILNRKSAPNIKQFCIGSFRMDRILITQSCNVKQMRAIITSPKHLTNDGYQSERDPTSTRSQTPIYAVIKSVNPSVSIPIQIPAQNTRIQIVKANSIGPKVTYIPSRSTRRLYCEWLRGCWIDFSKTAIWHASPLLTTKQLVQVDSRSRLSVSLRL